jgi:GntR family transcriptional regulator, colanic acid and biofilm gene transcriptional regulator
LPISRQAPNSLCSKQYSITGFGRDQYTMTDGLLRRRSVDLEALTWTKNVDDKAEGTLGQQIYQELERRILLGEWLPNTKVTLRTLALSLNTSMQPVREALGRLVAASVLEATPNRAFRVPELDRAAADEIWSLRLLLEGEAAARFAARRDPKACKRLAAATDACRAIDYGHDLKATMGAIAAWNSSIAQAAGSQLLYDTVGRLYLRCAPFLAYSLSAAVAHDEEFLSFILHIQDELTLAITAGDAAAARYLRCADLRSFQRYLYERIGWSSPLAAA